MNSLSALFCARVSIRGTNRVNGSTGESVIPASCAWHGADGGVRRISGFVRGGSRSAGYSIEARARQESTSFPARPCMS